jgi:virginiamycin A acetyltransferase
MSVLAVVRNATLRARLYLLKRHEFDSVRLRRFFLENYNIEIGMYSYGCFDRWRMPGPMRVGRYCSIAKTVRSTLNNHPLTALTTNPILYERSFGVVDSDVVWSGSLEIEDDAWIGHNAVILPGCKRIGRGAVVGAGSIVTNNVERYTIVAGNPARAIRSRFPSEMIDAIEQTRWWELDTASLSRRLRQCPAMFFNPTIDLLAKWNEFG